MINEDCEGSIAQAQMLAKIGIITQSEANAIVDGLKGILEDVNNGNLVISDKYEDIHYS